MPDFSGLKDIGAAGLAVFVVWVLYRVFVLFMGQWKNSTDAVNRNSISFEKLSTVFEKQVVREEQFQESVLSAIADGRVIASDTNQKVNEIYGSIILKRRKDDEIVIERGIS